MMRLGVNLLCATGFVEERHIPVLKAAKSAGFEGVEIPMLEGGPAHYAWLSGVLDDLELARSCTAIIPSPDADPTHADPEIAERGRAHLDWILDCAAALGVHTIGGPFHAPIGHFTGQGPTAEEWQRGAYAHREMAEKAATLGITLALEPLNRFESHYLNTAAQAATYCNMVGHPSFGIMYDTFHSHIEEKDQPQAIATLGDRIKILHVSENDRGVPGTGQIDFSAVFSAVKKTGFDGWVVMEAFGTGVPEIAAATRIWRPMFESHEALFAESARFIKECWSAA